MNHLTLRSFVDADFEVFVQAYDETWGWEISPEKSCPERRWTGEAYLAGNLLQSDGVRVSCVDGMPAGLLCASFETGGLDPAVRRLACACWTTMQSAEEALSTTPLGRSLIVFMEELHQKNAAMIAGIEQSGRGDAGPELVYFITHPRHRGRGAGKVLLNAFEEECRSRKASCAHLFTDDHCSWEGYLKSGWTKWAELPWSAPLEEEAMTSFMLGRRFD